MKVLLINNFYFPRVLGGAEVSVQTLAEQLVDFGHAVTVLTLSGSSVTSRFEHNNVHVVALGRSRLGVSPHERERSLWDRILWQLSASIDRKIECEVINVIEQFQPDVVNTFNLAGMTPIVWKGAERCSVPLVHTLYGTYLLCFRGPMFKNGRDCISQCLGCRLFTSSRRAASRRVGSVVGDSSAVLTRHVNHRYFEGADQYVINSGFSSVGEGPKGAQGSEAGFTIGFIGRLHATKGVEVLLDAVARLPTSRIRVLICGHGESHYEDRLKAMAGPNVEFLGWRNPQDFYGKVDAVVVPSIWNDPLPRVVFESFAYGKPVLGSRIGGIPEMVEEGRTGWLYDAGDSVALAKLIAGAATDRENVKAMREACLKSAQHYDSQRMARDYIALYRRIREWRGVGVR